MNTLSLKTITAVQGSALARVLQGMNLDGTIPDQFLDTDTLAATVWLAQDQGSIVTPTIAWFNSDKCQVSVSLSGSQMASLEIDTIYNLQVTATRGSTTYTIAWLYLQVLPAAGSAPSATPPDLITGAFAVRMLAGADLTETQLEQLPTLISTASAAWRAWCNRRFDQTTFTEECAVELDGYIRLSQIPVNQLLRVQSQLEVALIVSNSSSDVQSAWTNLAVSGDVITGQTVTGLVLNWESAGTLTTQTITYSDDETISTLATAINAVGSGWNATTGDGFASWPVTEIVDGATAKGCGPNDAPDYQASFHVYSSNVTNARFHPDGGQLTGLVWVGRQFQDLNQRWGPGLMEFQSGQPDISKVKVSYNAGFATIPLVVQAGVVELVKAYLDRMKTDVLLASEGAGEYRYSIAGDMIMTLPKHVVQAMALYRVHNA